VTALSYQIAGGDYEGGGAASRQVKDQLKKLGADPAVIRRAMVAAYEAEMNVVIHSQGGELRAELNERELRVDVIDTGPGISDVEQAMKPGFSTASAKARELGFGAGMGLPNIKKNSDEFAVESGAGRGTRVSFAIHLRPAALYGSGQYSVSVDGGKCRQSLHCLRACPTQAVRVFRGKPEILDYLCIDCAECVAACPRGAWGVRVAGEAFAASPNSVLVLPAASLVQFGAGIPAADVLSELSRLGFSDVRVTAAWEEALREAVLEYAMSEAQVRPVISPVCPAVGNLIQLRFPSLLPHVAPFVSAQEAACESADGDSRRVLAVVPCPCQLTALLARKSSPAPAAVLPAAMASALFPALARAGRRGVEDEKTRAAPGAPDVLSVGGIGKVRQVLERIEDGLLNDVAVVEPYACIEGCFGSPLFAENGSVARYRWLRAPLSADPQARAVRRSRPLEPRRGLRLDADMSRAIQKLARVDKLRRGLPGSDCGMCGSPTCAALAEDIVLGRAEADACVRQRSGGDSSDKVIR
jgi:anti-sigma regulatory factor (Ser/Thr protein kinase)/Fe-S-cluster-containing hydrogenase component 2